MRTFLYILGFSFFLLSCDRSRQPVSEAMLAWVPVYSQDSEVKRVAAGPVRNTVNAGKIFTIGNLIYQVEQDSGIHVINYSNPSAPQKLGFIRCFLAKEIAVKNGLIYTNNGADLVVIDATSISNVHEVGRTPDVFPDLALQYPSKSNVNETVYFECPDPSKGWIVKWEKKTISNANCSR